MTSCSGDGSHRGEEGSETTASPSGGARRCVGLALFSYLELQYKLRELHPAPECEPGKAGGAEQKLKRRPCGAVCHPLISSSLQ